MQPLSVKQMLRKYKFPKIYLYRQFVFVDPNVYYYQRQKGNTRIRLPESIRVYDREGRLFVCNYSTPEKAEQVVKSLNSFGKEQYFTGPVGPYVYKKERLVIHNCQNVYPNGAGIYMSIDDTQEND